MYLKTLCLKKDGPAASESQLTNDSDSMHATDSDDLSEELSDQSDISMGSPEICSSSEEGRNDDDAGAPMNLQAPIGMMCIAKCTLVMNTLHRYRHAYESADPKSESDDCE